MYELQREKFEIICLKICSKKKKNIIMYLVIYFGGRYGQIKMDTFIRYTFFKWRRL